MINELSNGQYMSYSIFFPSSLGLEGVLTMDRWGSCADRRLLGCCCNLVKKMEFNVLDSQNLLTEVLFDPVRKRMVFQCMKVNLGIPKLS